ncbi:uncharacterized protein [Fopius arisanus]|uniref:Uncharacterized protein n=1 Tax=Fopius arisanus TaxID=64838 RepID=A0A9R1TFX0_9HYME|nr:PREDICTED: uncharacterized protein LOC105269627 [Fopius arisanus]
MSDESTPKFAIVHFFKEKTDEDKQVVELLPGLWLRKVEGEWTCYWPPAKDNKYILKWVRDEKIPQDDWIMCDELKILGWADDYESGLRRVNRALIQAENIVTESDKESVRSTVSRISRKRARELMKISSKRENSTDSSSDDSAPFMKKPKTRKLMKQKTKRSRMLLNHDSESEIEISKVQRDGKPEHSDDSTSTLENDSLLLKKNDVKSKINKTRKRSSSPTNHCDKTPKSSAFKASYFSHLNRSPQKISPQIRVGSGLSHNPAEILREIKNKREECAQDSGGCSKENTTNRDISFTTPKSRYSDLSGYGSLVKNAYTKARWREQAAQLEELRNAITDPELGAVTDFLAAKLDFRMDILGNKIDNAKRSMNYDFKAGVDRLAVAKVSQSTHEFTSWNDIFGVNLPLKTVDDFDKFEESLNQSIQTDAEKQKEAKEKQNILRKKFTSQIAQYTDYMKCIKNIIDSVIQRDVQLLYSGMGRVCKNVQVKRPFNKTVCFQCMTDVMLIKFPVPPIPILTATSNYLSGAANRKGSSVVSGALMS